MNTNTSIENIRSEVSRELANPQTLEILAAMTFKGLKIENVKLAITEGLIRGFTFKDFLEKNVYAIPYGDGYSLVTSIDQARKIGMRSGVVGKSEPTYEMDGQRIIACSVTIKRELPSGKVGEFSSKVYFAEYTTSKNQWASKPRTMIAKVAEMHALRMAAPEEMSQLYVEEEREPGAGAPTVEKLAAADVDGYSKKLEACKTQAELLKEWSALPGEAKVKLVDLKNHLKESLK